jgi:5-methylcytosine-specific restriction endonuclease McrA
VRLRDGRCLDCGGKEGLTAHHVEPLAAQLRRLRIRTLEQAKARADELWPMTNGVTLCRDCHDNADMRAAGAAARASARAPDDGMHFGFVAAVVRGEGVVVAGLIREAAE